MDYFFNDNILECEIAVIAQKQQAFTKRMLKYAHILGGLTASSPVASERDSEMPDRITSGHSTNLIRKEHPAAETWHRLWLILEKESEWEKRCYQALKDMAEAHPICAWFIVAVLISILTGLLSNCIYNGIMGIE
ncbi:MAG: hypothetical protein J1F22_07360 [Lachnospiraceae bacterium]|nr:hypothetical protein [Lachnospiraceae bacterium]